MAENVKKRNASHIYYGVDAQSGELRHISEVESGLACGCVCALCGKRFEARKGTIRRHHFGHESNYECMYAGEVAIYQAFADILRKSGQLMLPAATLSFPAWDREEPIEERMSLLVDTVGYECAELAYPPILLAHSARGKVRILLDFGNYYDAFDYQRLSEEAKTSGYDCLAYTVPNVSEDEFFVPDNLRDIILNAKGARWVFNYEIEKWREKFILEARKPETIGDRRICPLHKDCWDGQYAVKRSACARCPYNVAQDSGCDCLGEKGIRSKDDFLISPAGAKARADAERAENEKRIAVRVQREKEQAERAERMERARRGPTRSDLDEEYQRIVESFDEKSSEPLYDKYDRRWVKCSICGIIKLDTEMTFIGFGGINMGECRACTRGNRD